MAKQYYVNQDGNLSGPHTAAELKEKASQGTLQLHALISADNQNWVAAANVKGLTFPQLHLDDDFRPAEIAVAVPPVSNVPNEEGTVAEGSTKPEVQPTGEASGRIANLNQKGRAVLNKLNEIRSGVGIETARRVGEKIKQGGERALTVGDGYQLQHAAQSRPVKYDVFLSYRRHGGAEIARFLAEKLQRTGYEVFLDVDGLAEGDWSEALEHHIDQCEDFIPIITADFFTRCENPNDVVRKEISHALSKGKNIVPLFATDTPFPDSLPEELAELPKMNGLQYVHEYADPIVGKLCTMLRSGRMGPARLETGELQPRIVVAVVAILLGLCFGNVAIFFTKNPFVSVFATLFTSAASAFSSVTLFAIPLLLVQTIVSAVAGARPEKYYGGRAWAIFWVMFCPLVTLPTAFLVPFAVTLFASWTYKSPVSHSNIPMPTSMAMPTTLTRVCASIFGMLIAFLIMRVVLATKAWSTLTRTTGLSKWV